MHIQCAHNRESSLHFPTAALYKKSTAPIESVSPHSTRAENQQYHADYLMAGPQDIHFCGGQLPVVQVQVQQ